MNIHKDSQTVAALTLGSSASLYLLYKFFYAQNEEEVKCEEGVFNYRKLKFMPDTSDEIRYKEPTSTIGKMVQGAFYGLMQQFLKMYSVDFHNARQADIDYEKTGFTLVKSPVEECDWQNKDNRENFYKAMEKTIRELHPDAAELHWIDAAFLSRNTEGGNPPAVDGPHLDYYVDQNVSKEWCGYDQSGYDIVLGIWKPANMTTPVVDFPLAVMDASTFHKSQVIPMFGEMSNYSVDGAKQSFKFLSGAMKHSDKQKWYYYPEQTSDEILIFRQYTNEKNGEPFACPHTSFTEPKFPKSAPSRRSVETRVGITLRK